MWMALPVSHRLCLIALAFTMLVFAPEADSISIGLICCSKSFNCKEPKIIKQCVEQKSRHGCPHHAFLIMTENKTLCVNPKTEWLLKLIEMGKLKCPPAISYKHRFKFLDRDEWQTLFIKQRLWNE